MKYQILVLRLLIHCLEMLMDIKAGQHGSHYVFTKENEVIKDAQLFVKINQ